MGQVPLSGGGFFADAKNQWPAGSAIEGISKLALILTIVPRGVLADNRNRLEDNPPALGIVHGLGG